MNELSEVLKEVVEIAEKLKDDKGVNELCSLLVTLINFNYQAFTMTMKDQMPYALYNQKGLARVLQNEMDGHISNYLRRKNELINSNR